jgi:hypothetical protein
MKRIVRWSAWHCGLVVALLATLQGVADPVLPYSQPIADKLTNDIAVLQETPNRTPAQNQELSRDTSALKAFQRESKTWNTDITILRNLYQLLAVDADYVPVLNQAITDYYNDFSGREQTFRRTTDTSPRSNVRTNAYRQLNILSNNLRRANLNLFSQKSLTHLGAAARRLASASNAVNRAASAKVRASSAYAKIGKINFNSVPKNTGGTLSNGILEFWASSAGFTHPIPPENPDEFRPPAGFVTRDFFFHVEGVSEETPGTYFLGAGNNVAGYFVSDVRLNNNKPKFVFVPFYPTNGSVLIIDAIKTNYMVGRFNFFGFTTNPAPNVDTNVFVTITNGEFQLTF